MPSSEKSGREVKAISCHYTISNNLFLDLEDYFNFHSRSCGKRCKSKCTSSVKPVAILAVQLMEQVGGTINDEVLIGELECRIYTSKYLDYTKTVECPVCVMNRLQDFNCTFFRRGISLLDI